MGFLSNRETVEHVFGFATGPTALFALFTDPQHGKALMGAKTFSITQGQPKAPGKMVVVATYDTASMKKDLPPLAGIPEIATRLEITLGENPPRSLVHSTFGAFKQQSQIIFTPQGSGTELSYSTTYEVALPMRPFSTGIRNTFDKGIRHTFVTLALLAQDSQAQASLRQRGFMP